MKRKPLGDRINDRLAVLTACLCAELTPDGAPKPFNCQCLRLPGQFPGEAYTGEGEDIAWTRVAAMYPSEILGQAARTPGNCGYSTGWDVEIGVMRCLEIDREGNYLPESLESVADRVIEDYAAVRRAVACCEGPVTDPWTAKDWIVGPWTPRGPTGLLVGGSVIIQMGF